MVVLRFSRAVGVVSYLFVFLFVSVAVPAGELSVLKEESAKRFLRVSTQLALDRISESDPVFSHYLGSSLFIHGFQVGLAKSTLVFRGHRIFERSEKAIESFYSTFDVLLQAHADQFEKTGNGRDLWEDIRSTIGFVTLQGKKTLCVDEAIATGGFLKNERISRLVGFAILREVGIEFSERYVKYDLEIEKQRRRAIVVTLDLEERAEGKLDVEIDRIISEAYENYRKPVDEKIAEAIRSRDGTFQKMSTDELKAKIHPESWNTWYYGLVSRMVIENSRFATGDFLMPEAYARNYAKKNAEWFWDWLVEVETGQKPNLKLSEREITDARVRFKVWRRSNN